MNIPMDELNFQLRFERSESPSAKESFPQRRPEIPLSGSQSQDHVQRPIDFSSNPRIWRRDRSRKAGNSKRLVQTAQRRVESITTDCWVTLSWFKCQLRDVYYPIRNASIANLSVVAAAEASVPQVRCWLIHAPPLPCQARDEGNVTAAAYPTDSELSHRAAEKSAAPADESFRGELFARVSRGRAIKSRRGNNEPWINGQLIADWILSRWNISSSPSPFSSVFRANRRSKGINLPTRY